MKSNKSVTGSLLTILFLFGLNFVVAQECTIKGKIIDADKRSIPGASILLKGTPIGVASDIDGKYQVKIPCNKSRLIIAAMGFKNFEREMFLSVDSTYSMDVILVPDKKKYRNVKSTGILVASRAVD